MLCCASKRERDRARASKHLLRNKVSSRQLLRDEAEKEQRKDEKRGRLASLVVPFAPLPRGPIASARHSIRCPGNFPSLISFSKCPMVSGRQGKVDEKRHGM